METVLLYSIAFLFVAMVAALLFHRRISMAQANYEESKSTVRNISLAYRRHVDDQNEKIAKLAMRIGVLEGQISEVNRETSVRLEEINRKIDLLPKVPHRPALARPTPKMALAISVSGELLSKLTDTELTVIRTLVKEGPKTASQIREIVGKSREHTARLMKKLYEDGFIERDAGRMPFTYRPTKEVEGLLKKEGGW
ncbi:MAG: helix-turn-helix domain-containing protein [Candidatus Bathyarchaeia archaeon]